MTVHPLTLQPAKSALPLRSSCSSSRHPIRCRYLGLQHTYCTISPSASTASQFIPPASPRHHKGPSRQSSSSLSSSSDSTLGNLRQSYIGRGSALEQPSLSTDEQIDSLEQQQQEQQEKLSKQQQERSSCFIFPDSDEEDTVSVNSDLSSIQTSPSRTSDSSSSQQRRRRVQFSTSVAVKEIPSRHAYPTDVRLALWNSRKQIRRSASRNSFEYAWEGHNWRTAVEEEHFLPLNGGRQWIHPAHVQNWEELNQYYSNMAAAPNAMTCQPQPAKFEPQQQQQHFNYQHQGTYPTSHNMAPQAAPIAAASGTAQESNAQH